MSEKQKLIKEAMQINTEILELQEKAKKTSALSLRPVIQELGQKQLLFNAKIIGALCCG